MKKSIFVVLCGAIFASGVFAQKNWNVELQAKVKAVEVEDITGEQIGSAFSKNIFDDDTVINFTYDDNFFEAAFEITPVFFWTDEDFNPVQDGQMPALKEAISTLYAGIRIKDFAKVRAGIHRDRTNNHIKNFRVNEFIDELKLGLLSHSLGGLVETDKINGPVMLDFYFGNQSKWTLQIAPTPMTFSREKAGGVQSRLIADFEKVQLALNYSLDFQNEFFTNKASAFAKLNFVEDFPILVGANLLVDSENLDFTKFGAEVRFEKDFGVIGFGLHNNATFMKNEMILYNGLGVKVPIVEKLAANLEVNNFVNFKNSSYASNFNDNLTNGRVVVYPYVSYSPVENATLSLGVTFDTLWAGENSITNFGVPLKVVVSF